MRLLLGSAAILAAFGAVAGAADPTPDQALALLMKLKAKTRPPKAKDAAKITTIDLGRKKITTDDVKVLAVLKSVRELNLGGPIVKESAGKKIFEPKQIGDEALKALEGMTELTTLELDGTHVTDAGLKHLAGMKKLKTLILSSTRVTDEGMQELTKLPKLETVTLFDTKITDAGVTILKRWKLELVVNR